MLEERIPAVVALRFKGGTVKVGIERRAGIGPEGDG